jgi:hypothetical protein
MTDPDGVEEQLKAALLAKLTQHAGPILGQLTSTVDPTVLLAPSGPVALVIDTTTTTDPVDPPPPSPPPMAPPPMPGTGPARGQRYTDIAPFRANVSGTTIVWSAQDTQQDNMLVYAMSVRFRPTQSATWTGTPPTTQRYIGVQQVQRQGFAWGIDGFRWWQGIDTQDETGHPEVYVGDADAPPDDTATWIPAATFEERMAVLEGIKAERKELFDAVDAGLARALNAVRAIAVSSMEKHMAYPKHGDDRWFLPSRNVIGGVLRSEVDRLLQT